MRLNASELVARFIIFAKDKPQLVKPSDRTTIPVAAQKWEKETRCDPSQLDLYFKRLPSGKFEHEFITRFYHDLIDSLS